MEKHDTSNIGTFSNYMTNYVVPELDRGLTLKYFGEINGKLGIGTQKLNVNIKEVFDKNLFHSNNISLTNSKRIVQLKNRVKLKQPLPDIKNEKIIIISDKIQNQSKQPSLIFKKSKDLPKSVIGQKINKIDVYGNLLENINFEVNNGNKPEKLLTHYNFNFMKNRAKNENLKPLVSKANKAYIPSYFMKKERVFSASEIIDPERYRKKKINIDEILQHHNSLHRREMMSDKISLRHMKRSIDLINNIKDQNLYSKKLDSKFVSSMCIINLKTCK